MKDLNELLLNNPIIGAIKNDDDLEQVMESDIKIVFVLYGTITNISDITKKLRDHNKIYFIHLEMIEGLKSDEQGLIFIKQMTNPEGIISTKAAHIKLAKKHSLHAILRIFVIDSISLNVAIRCTLDYKPTAIEILPATSYRAMEKICNEVDKPVIGGGLIVNKEEVLKALESGIVSVSTTSKEVWEM